MTQPTSGTAFGLTITRIINAPRERVFAAWTDPDHLHRWWGAQDGYTAPIVEVDLRPGAGTASVCRTRNRPTPTLWVVNTGK